MDLSSIAGGSVSQDDIIAASLAQNAALTRKNSDLRPALQLRYPIDLSTARTNDSPLKIGGPFDGFYVENAGTTDSSTQARISYSSNEKGNLDNYTTIAQNDSASFSEPVREIFITNTAQSGKTLMLILYLGVGFKPGSMINTLSGGVTVVTGSGMTANAATLVTTAAGALFTTNAARKKVTIQVLTGAGIYISGINTLCGASGGATGLIGIFVPVGGTFEWTNTGACYALVDTGAPSALVSLNTET